MNPLDTVDVIGVVHVVGPAGDVTLKNGITRERRNTLICDEGNFTCCVCFWGDAARSIEFEGNPVVAIKGAKVSDFANKSLNSSEESVVLVNPDIQRARDLKAWYKKGETLRQMKPLSFGTGLDSMIKEKKRENTLMNYGVVSNAEERIAEMEEKKRKKWNRTWYAKRSYIRKTQAQK